MADVLAIIPARSGSKGVPGKNVKLLAGKPLLAYSIAAARSALNIDRVIVSTDSEQYAHIALKYSAEAPFLRPVEISGDNSTDYEVIKHLLDWMKANRQPRPEFLVYLRPTTPLRDVMVIETAIERLKQSNDASALRSVHEMSESAYKTLEVEKGYLKCIASGSFDVETANRPRQEYCKTYHANGYVDVIRSSYVLENKKIFGDRVSAYITPLIIEVDTLEDFHYLEYQVTREPMIAKKLFE